MLNARGGQKGSIGGSLSLIIYINDLADTLRSSLNCFTDLILVFSCVNDPMEFSNEVFNLIWEK